jgi:hypothetical protein
LLSTDHKDWTFNNQLVAAEELNAIFPCSWEVDFPQGDGCAHDVASVFELDQDVIYLQYRFVLFFDMNEFEGQGDCALPVSKAEIHGQCRMDGRESVCRYRTETSEKEDLLGLWVSMDRIADD